MGLVRQGLFRDDLYYRLDRLRIELPPLRERREDIPLLIEHFVATQRHSGGRTLRFSDEALRCLCEHSWPGNVRELRNVVERLAVFSDGEVTVRSLRKVFGSTRAELPNWREANDRFQRQLLVQAMVECAGNRHEMARRLGLPRSTLHRLLRRHGLDCAPEAEGARTDPDENRSLSSC